METGGKAVYGNGRESSLWKREGKLGVLKANETILKRNDTLFWRTEKNRHTRLANRNDTTHSSGAQKRNDTLFWRTETKRHTLLAHRKVRAQIMY